MPKGQQKSNREKKKPKAPKAPAAPKSPFSVPPGTARWARSWRPRRVDAWSPGGGRRCRLRGRRNGRSRWLRSRAIRRG